MHKKHLYEYIRLIAALSQMSFFEEDALAELADLTSIPQDRLEQDLCNICDLFFSMAIRSYNATQLNIPYSQNDDESKASPFFAVRVIAILSCSNKISSSTIAKISETTHVDFETTQAIISRACKEFTLLCQASLAK